MYLQTRVAPSFLNLFDTVLVQPEKPSNDYGVVHERLALLYCLVSTALCLLDVCYDVTKNENTNIAIY